MLFRNRKLISNMKRILGWIEGGVHKRIDENRELLELVRERAPEFVATHPWVVTWIQSRDNFFCELAAAVPLSGGRFPLVVRTGPADVVFPRHWPGESGQSLHRPVDRANQSAPPA